jgi:hypothetical protein
MSAGFTFATPLLPSVFALGLVSIAITAVVARLAAYFEAARTEARSGGATQKTPFSTTPCTPPSGMGVTPTLRSSILRP